MQHKHRFLSAGEVSKNTAARSPRVDGNIVMGTTYVCDDLECLETKHVFVDGTVLVAKEGLPEQG